VASELDFRYLSAAEVVGYRDRQPVCGGALRPHACGLHECEGYVPIGNLNGNPVAMFFGEKRLSG
jgi:hypothetical protein